MSDILLSVDGDTRPLESKLNRISSKSINFNLKDGISQPLGRITGKVSEFDKSLEASNARVLAFGASAGAVYALGRAFKEMVSSTIEVEKSLTDINVVLNASSSQLSQFSSGLFNVAKNTGQSFSEVAKAATELARQGLGIEETLKRTSDALILTRLSGLGAAQSVETLTAAVNGFSKAGLTTSEVLNKLSTVDQAFAVSSADLANALSRVGSTAQDVGVGIDELIAIVTAAQQTTARGGAVIGNSLKTIFTRLQRTDTLQELENLGIAIKDVAGNTLPAVQILKNLSNVFYQLGDAQRASVAETVGGVFQINILRAALGDLSKEFSIYDSALRTSATATDQAIQKNEELNQTLSALINKTLANLTQSGAKVGEITIAPTIKGGLNVLNKALEGFNQPTEAQGVGTKIATGILEGIGSYLSGPGVAVISAVFLKIFGRLTSFSAEALKGLLGISSQTDLIGQAQAKVNAILAQNPALVEAIITKQASLLQIENQILKIIQAQNTARSAAATISASVVPKVVKGVGPSKTKSFGFVPNFSPEMQEVMGAQQGGYQAGNIKRMNIPGEGNVIYNDAESVVRFPGSNQPAIIPPENSKAGKDYRKQFEKEAGFDPYASKGFIPNFAKIPQGMSIEDAIKKNYSRSMLSQRYGAASVNEKLGPARVRSTASKEDINLGFTNRLSMIYPAKTGISKATGAFRDVEGDRYRISFSKSGFNAKTAIRPEDAQLENSLSKELIKFVNNYIAQLSNGKFQKVNNIKELANAGGFGSIVGTIFETAVTYATQSFKPRAGGQSALVDFPSPNKNLRELFNQAPGQYEAKGNDNQDLINDVARKIYQTGLVNTKIQKRKSLKSSGFIPNFSALQEAIEREKKAGVNPSKIRVGSDNSLISRDNPYGLGVYNTKDEPGGLKQGIDRAKSKGYIPNYAQKQESQQQIKEDGFDKFQSKLLAASIALQLASGVTNKFADQTSQSTKTFNDLISSVSNAAAAFAASNIFGKRAGKFVGPALAFGMGAMQYSGMQKEKENAPYITQIQKLEEKLNSLKESGSQLESVLSKTGVILNNYSAELENAIPDQTKIQDFRKQFLDAISDLPTELRSSLLETFKNQPILDKQTPSLLMGPLNQAQAQNQTEQGMSTLQQNLTRERQKQNEVLGSQSGFMRSLRNSFPIFGQNKEIESYNPFASKTFSERTSRTILGDALSKGKDESEQTKILTNLGEKLVEAGSDGKKFIEVLTNFSSGTEQSEQAFEELIGVLASGGPQAMKDFSSSMLKEIQALADNAKTRLSSSIPGQPTKIPADYKDISKTMDINEILGTQTEDMSLKLWATSSMRKRAQGVDSRTSGMYAVQELQQIASLNSGSFEEIQTMAPEVTNLAMQEVMKGQEERAKALEDAYGKNAVSESIRKRNTPEAAQAYLTEALDIKNITGKMFEKEPPIEINTEPIKQAVGGLEEVLKKLENIKTIEVKLNDSDREILQGKGTQGVSQTNDAKLGIGDKIIKEIQAIDWKQAFSTMGPAILLTVGQIAAAIITRGKSLKTSTTIGTFAKIPNFAKLNIDQAKNIEKSVT
jgi:TP901 family phage tail tape measure protein